MKVGDLVICKFVKGMPLGVIVAMYNRLVGSKGGSVQVYDVFMEGDTYPFQAHLVEAV